VKPEAAVSDPTFRIAGLDDLPALHALIERAYRGDSARVGWTHEADLLGGQRTDLEDLTAILTDPGRVMLLASRDDALVGCVQLADEGDGLAYLGMLSIEPSLQAAGLGRALVTAAEAEVVRRFDADRMRMTVIRQRTELIAWYERRGYFLTGAEAPFPMDDERFGLPKRRDLAFVVMEKAL
jgi:ribosomal protein S18 acetylase RimI-like enzyme